MSYLAFLIFFVLLPALVLLLLSELRANKDGDLRQRSWHWKGTAILALIAFVWTTPWDNYIVAKEVWSYGADRVLAVIGYVPLEEYLFFILMPLFNSALIACLFSGSLPGPSTWRVRQKTARSLAIGLGLVLVCVAGLLQSNESFSYLSLILFWFVPPLVLQWVFDPQALIRKFGILLPATLLPTLYFSIVDAYAIREGIWTIHDATRSGWELRSLPLEEAFFFSIVSLLLAQGLILWHSLPRR
jgi:putative membrane protein